MRLARKVTLAITGVSVVAGVLLAGWTHYRTDQLSADLARQSALAGLQVAVDAQLRGLAPPPDAAVGDPGLPPPLAEAVRSGRTATYLDGEADPPVVWAATTSAGRPLSVRRPYDGPARLMADLDRTLVVGVLGTALLSTVLAVLLGTGMAGRIRAAATTARRIADGELQARIGPAAGGTDEVADLSRAIDAMAAALGDRLDAERRVTADIAHDLRTPVAGLVTASELLPEGRPTELVRDRVGRLRGLVEDVLEVARLDIGADDVELRAVSCAVLVRGAVAEHGPPVRVEVRADTPVETDPRRAHRVLDNLVRNALAHGGDGGVTLVVDGATVRVRDEGPGFPAELLDAGPQRFRTGSGARTGGNGLGLTIAAGQAAVVGATLELRNPPGGGAEAVLTFPAVSG